MRSHYTGTLAPRLPFPRVYDVAAACDKLRISMLRTTVFAPITVVLLIAATIFVATLSLFAAARPAGADEPVITYEYPQEGDVFAEPLLVFQFCFEEPIDVRDLPPNDEGEFSFDLERPNGLRVGMRIVFQANGYGVAVYPGTVEEEDQEGEWTMTFTVRDRETLEQTSHSVTYEVAPGGEAIITPTPQLCPAGGTFAPTAAPTAGPDGSPGATPEPGSDEDDDDPDLLVISLLTIGAAGGAGLIALLGYVFRRRIGWWLHKPSDEPDTTEHH